MEALDEFPPASADEEINSGKRDANEDILRFLDSVDDYLELMQSLSSKISQGWMDLASARHSMGTSRISSTLFDLKPHSAVTKLQLGLNDGNHLHFGLNKWGSHETGAKLLNDDQEYKKLDSAQLRRRGSTEDSVPQTKGKQPMADVQVQKERAKSLSMFGTLVSPKLRSAQLSFETALETLVQIANTRSSLLQASDNVSKKMESSRK